jgi:hypothetical protein
VYTSDWSNIMRLSIVVPGDDLHEVDTFSLFDEELPSRGKEPVISTVDEILVETTGSIMLFLCRHLILLHCRQVRTVNIQGETAAI